MFGIDSGEILIIAVVALVVIGPKDLPRVMRTLGNFMGRARGMARHFRSGLDAMIREAELEDMEKQWKANNERIMRESPSAAIDSDWGKPGPPPGDDRAAMASESGPQPAAPASDAGAADAAKPKAPPRRASRNRSKAAAPPIPDAQPPRDERP